MSSTKTIFNTFTLNTSAVADYYMALANGFLDRWYKVVIISEGKRTHKVSKNIYFRHQWIEHLTINRLWFFPKKILSYQL